MEYADRGELHRVKGDLDASREAFKEAFLLEREAANRAAVESGEPDRSVLLRSAASLALECDELREAERLIAVGLAGEPPDEIAEEMRDLLEQAHFQRHLELRGWALERSEVQMSIAGEAIGYGVASSEEFVGRVKDLERLILRTAERRLGRPYREGGSPAKDLREGYELYLSVPRAASFAVTLRLGRPKEQLTLEGVSGQPDVIDEVLDLLDAAQRHDQVELHRQIPEGAYYRNFVALAKKLAPDGQDVSVVGLTAVRGERVRRLALTVSRKELKMLTTTEPTEPTEYVQVRGVLHFADSLGGGAGRIKLEEPDGRQHTIVVPEGMMADIVRPLWDDEVIVSGRRVRGTIQLEEIDRATTS